MNAREFFKNVTNFYATETAYSEDGFKVRIFPTKSLLTIEIRADIQNPEKAKSLVEIVNRGQTLLRYDIDGTELVSRTTMWVDVRPTKTSLTEVANIALSQFKSNKMLIEGVMNEQQ